MGTLVPTMTPDNDGIILASNPETLALGSTISVKLDFLAKARKMAAPEVADVVIRLYGTVGGHTATALGKDGYKFVKKFICADDDEFVNVSGASIRVLEQMDFGAKQVDTAAVASAASNTTWQQSLRFTFEPPRMENPGDYRMPVTNFLDGGQMQIQIADAVPTGYTTSSTLSFRVFARVVDAKKKSLKSRRKVTEQSYNRDDDFYPTDGAIRALILSSVLTTTGYTALTGITVLNSTNLDFFPDLPFDVQLSRYRRGHIAINESTDEFVAQNAIALVTPDLYQKIVNMPQVRAAHLRLGSTPTSAVLIKDVLVARPPNISAMHMGFPDIQSYQLALLHGGHVKDQTDNGTHVRKVAPELARIMPLEIKPEG
jgi:hypothetical protein